MKFRLLGILLLASFSVFSQPKKKKEFVFTIISEYGKIEFILYDETPLHKANFLKLVKEEFYNGTTFHRVINQFMIQGGDPNSKDTNPLNDGNGGPGYTLKNEILPQYFHKKGAIAAARMGDAVNPEKESSGSQFYIVQGKVFTSDEINMLKKRGLSFNEDQIRHYTTIGGSPHLDGGYTVFGEVINGLDVVDTIAVLPKDHKDRPLEDVKISITVQELKVKKINKLYGLSL